MLMCPQGESVFGTFDTLVLKLADFNRAVKSFCDCRTRICNLESHFSGVCFKSG
jgi:hypothetical protein